jgi:hypothetical protein
MWCHYCDKNNHKTADCRAIANFKQQKNKKTFFETKAGLGKQYLAFFFQEINALKRKLQLKHEMTKSASSKKSNAECILFSLY